MRAFYSAYGQVAAILSQVATELSAAPPPAGSTPILAQAAPELPPPETLAIPWFHNVILIQKVKDPALRLWYARQAAEHGWSRSILALQIQSKLHLRQGKAVTNFKQTLPAPQSDLAQQLVKDPYNFGFLTLGADARERDLELALIEHLSKFLVELGTGFAFVGRQVHLEVGEDDFYLDLLF
jgi:predicted nuclease of restriction endonuclease-like (RecB) superfamily